MTCVGVKAEIDRRIKSENATNARLLKVAQAKKDQANKFANRGGGMRKVAKTMKEVAAKMEGELVDVRRDDVALAQFFVPFQHCSSSGRLGRIEQVSGFQRTGRLPDGPMDLRKGSRVHVFGPNGIGKTTFLERIALGTCPGFSLADDAVIGYYRQDFNNFDFTATGLECLEKASDSRHSIEQLRSTAGSFLLPVRTIQQPVGTLSEGQKGLLSLACLCLLRPSILIMDEPTNHINFRHIPALANAVRSFDGAVLLVSHDAHFVASVGAVSSIDMGEVLGVTRAAGPGAERIRAKAV